MSTPISIVRHINRGVGNDTFSIPPQPVSRSRGQSRGQALHSHLLPAPFPPSPLPPFPKIQNNSLSSAGSCGGKV